MQFNNDRIWRWLVLAAAVYFLVRGPWRAIHDNTGFLWVFAAARCWITRMAVAVVAAAAVLLGYHFTMPRSSGLVFPSCY